MSRRGASAQAQSAIRSRQVMQHWTGDVKSDCMRNLRRKKNLTQRRKDLARQAANKWVNNRESTYLRLAALGLCAFA